MAGAKVASQVEVLDVVDTGRRRRWTFAEKVRIVEESLAGSRRAAATARRHGISRSLLTRWRRAYREGRLEADGAPMFSRVTVTPALPPPPAARAAPLREEVAGRMEIVLEGGRRVVVGADVEATALARVLDVLERR